MLLSLAGAIFVALKGWVIWWCWDVLGRCCPGSRWVDRRPSQRFAPMTAFDETPWYFKVAKLVLRKWLGVASCFKK
jgi:hypothetical protein